MIPAARSADDARPLFGKRRRRPLAPHEVAKAAKHWSAWWDRRNAERDARATGGGRS